MTFQWHLWHLLLSQLCFHFNMSGVELDCRFFFGIWNPPILSCIFVRTYKNTFKHWITKNDNKILTIVVHICSYCCGVWFQWALSLKACNVIRAPEWSGEPVLTKSGKVQAQSSRRQRQRESQLEQSQLALCQSSTVLAQIGTPPAGSNAVNQIKI